MDVLEFDNFQRDWMKMERDRHAQILRQLKRELALKRRERSDRQSPPVRAMVRR